MFDTLEVLFLHAANKDRHAALEKLREAFDGNFDVEAHEFIDDSRQVIRIIASTDEFESAIEFDEHLRELADEDEFRWKLIGAVPVGQIETVLA